MLLMRCIGKFCDKQGRVYGYTLMSNSGRKRNVDGNDIKRAISRGEYRVINLRVTKDGKIIDTEERPDDTNRYVTKLISKKEEEEKRKAEEEKRKAENDMNEIRDLCRLNLSLSILNGLRWWLK